MSDAPQLTPANIDNLDLYEAVVFLRAPAGHPFSVSVRRGKLSKRSRMMVAATIRSLIADDLQDRVEHLDPN